MIVYANDRNLDELLTLMFKWRNATLPQAVFTQTEAILWLGNDAIVVTPKSPVWFGTVFSAPGRKVGDLIDTVVKRRQTIFKEGGRHERLDEAGIGQGNVPDSREDRCRDCTG